jgi:hypothetical protein
MMRRSLWYPARAAGHRQPLEGIDGSCSHHACRKRRDSGGDRQRVPQHSARRLSSLASDISWGLDIVGPSVCTALS